VEFTVQQGQQITDLFQVNNPFGKGLRKVRQEDGLSLADNMGKTWE